MCQVLPKVRAAVVISADPEVEKRLLATWPATADLDDHMLDVGLSPTDQPVFTTRTSASGKQLLRLVKKIPGAGETVLVLELEAEVRQQSVIIQLLDWGEHWLTLLRSTTSPSATRSLQAIRETIKARDAHAGLTAAATHLAQAYCLERVFIGLAEGDKVKVCAVSHNVRIDRRSNLVTQVEAAMTEAFIARSLIDEVQADKYPAFARLKHSQQMSRTIVIPLPGEEVPVGAILLENQSEADFPSEQRKELVEVANLLGPSIALRERAEQSVRARLMRDARNLIEHLVGPRFLPLKVAILTIVIAMPILSLIDSTYEIVAPATLEGRVQRAIVAPFSGYIKLQTARAGDSVTEGQVIAELDARDLELDRQRLFAERADADKLYRQALAIVNQTDVKIYSSQRAQADVRLAQIKSQINRARLTAPMSGIVIQGDLSRSLGAPVERGDVLFEVAPLDDYRLVLDIDEASIDKIEQGQIGLLVLNAFPDEKIEFTLEEVGGAREHADGSITFRAEAAISEDDIGKLRPGMSGVARVNAGVRSLLWIHSHDILEWLRLAMWRYLP